MGKILLEKVQGLSSFGTAVSSSGVNIPCNVKDDSMIIVLNGTGKFTIKAGDSDFATGDLEVTTTEAISIITVETAKYKKLKRTAGEAYGCITIASAVSSAKAGILGRGVGNGLYYSPTSNTFKATSDPALS